MVADISTVLVTGGAGFIGSVLTEMLLEKGYDVIVLDRFFFGQTLAHLCNHKCLRLVKDDIRWFDASLLDGVDAVIDLAALSNDPSGELNPDKTMEINYKGRVRVAKLSIEKGAKRYVLASSCSVYGFQEDLLEETSPINPLTTYAEANSLAEKQVLKLKGRIGTAITVLRQATVYGLSPRMRFDLAINGMTLGLFKNGVMPILRDGNQWRPMIHVRDTSQAFIKILEADAELVNGEIFNVGVDEQNFQILPLAKRLADAVKLPFKMEWYGLPDHRSYRVSFRKIREVLNFQAAHTPELAAREIFDALNSKQVKDEPKTRTVQWYKDLIYWQNFLNEVAVNNVIL